MEYSAVLFDLFGTLAPGGTRELRDNVSLEVARDLGVDPDAFATAIGETFRARTLGQLGTLEETLATLASRLGGSPSADDLTRAAGRRTEMTAGLLADTWALDVLDELRARGYSLGLVSDCSIETALIWPESALAERFDVAAFSAVHGIKKPAAELYRVATDALGVAPEQCVYVGDGGSTELPGAADLGMRAVWLNHPGNQGGAADPEWSGETVTELAEILAILPSRHPEATTALTRSGDS
ncbi:HAD family hydrolase [Frondihabitans sp. 4ASC-45]|uniref:HAD family hydrolase n=1 Tax=Frondihabitans sp. 4ASC-45 TaxID=3111636 RepID=UPI003C23BC77